MRCFDFGYAPIGKQRGDQIGYLQLARKPTDALGVAL
jgi:hypothetical protein